MILHHIGYVVADIATSAPAFARSLNVAWDGVVTHDPLQFVRVTFLPSGRDHAPLIELVEPAAPRSPVRKFLDAGGGLHHLCYEVPDLGAALKQSTDNGDAVVRVPLPAQAFGNRRIAWIRTSEQLLVELLEGRG
jgi:methylmalonyl-CoA/ethylmalonyl-CoA epimerase